MTTTTKKRIRKYNKHTKKVNGEKTKKINNIKKELTRAA